MATSRDPSQFGRKRSNTAQSSFRSISTTHATLKLGDSKVLNAWVHDHKDNQNVVFNQTCWPGVAEGDLLRVAGRDSEMEDAAFLFMVPKDEGCPKPQLQVEPERFSADYVELVFQDQYLGRSEMWRMGKSLAGHCIYAGQEVSFVGGIAAKIQAIYIGKHKVSLTLQTFETQIHPPKVPSAYMTTKTNAIYRSLSAKITIFIQVCRELWEFAGDGERYNEKIIHSFLPALFAKWREAGTNHTVTIVLISRVYYDESEIDYAAGPLRKDDLGNWYKDFFKVITDLEVIHEWKPTLINLKDSFWDFQRDILLTHHYHNATQDPDAGVRLVGTISCAQDGPILEALNLGLNPTETHYIDRSLNLTGAATIIISPGTGYFRVSKRLLRLTTTRMLDQGFLLDLVLLTKPPLHQSPIFSFQGYDPRVGSAGGGGGSGGSGGGSGGRMDKDEKIGQDSKSDPFLRDPLWGGDDDRDKERKGPKKTFWWEPFWISTTFWGLQMDLPFRQDRFVASAKMHEIQMLGLLEHDVLSTIEVPYLPEHRGPGAGQHDRSGAAALSKEQTDRFDQETFAFASDYPAPSTTPQSTSSTRTIAEKRASQRSSTLARIAIIEESPKRIHRELPPENIPVTAISNVTATGLGSSPSQASLRSNHSDHSSRSLKSVNRSSSISKGTLASKLAPSWFFNPFRGTPSEPQTTQVSASASPQRVEKTPASHQKPSREPTGKEAALVHPSSKHHSHHHQHPTHPSTPPSAPIRMPGKHTSPSAMQPVTIKPKGTTRSALSRTYEEESLMPHRAPYARRSPINTPPRDEIPASKRRSLSAALGPAASVASSIPSANPIRPRTSISYPQVSLASRWQHLFPVPLYKHDLKWTSIVTPGCLPLTVEHFPSVVELESSFDVFSYGFIVDPSEMKSFLVKPPNVRGNSEEVRKAWALVVMRGMAAVRLAQGFQFIIRSKSGGGGGASGGGGGGGGLGGDGMGSVEDEKQPPLMRRTKSYAAAHEEESIALPAGAAEVLKSTAEPVYLSMSNEIHCISYTGEVINVKRYVRRVNPSKPFEYQCLIWPKLGGGYTQLTTKFSEHGLENYGWNRLDMLVAGYEHHFNESLRYWRTRFIVIPTAEPPHVNVGPSGENLNHEEARIFGIERLAEQFTKLRWQPPAEKIAYPPVRFLPTTLGPIMSVLDDSLMEHLDQIHAAGPLRKKVKSEKDIADMPLQAIAKAMRDPEDGVPIKFYQWHKNQYPNSFIGYDFVSWLIREFRDVSNRAQATEWGIRLLEQGLFEHCRGYHGFLDGHYFYRLKGEYSIPMTPRYNWPFSGRRNTDDGVNPFSPFRTPRTSGTRKKQLILSQTMVIDIDQHRKSDQAECVILHHDIIHNPATVFHFELQWIGTTARCIEDQLRVWNRTIERYGLKMVEAYVTQISDIRERSAFQSCFPMRLALEPPVVPDIELRLPEGTQSKRYFEYAILQKFGFILDVEAADFYPPQVDVVYSYRRSPYKYSQFVHRSGVAFIQVIGGKEGFLFLTNRLMAPGRTSPIKNRNSPGVAAEGIRVEMTEFCEDESKLRVFYEEQIALLPPVPTPTEEPPPLAI